MKYDLQRLQASESAEWVKKGLWRLQSWASKLAIEKIKNEQQNYIVQKISELYEQGLEIEKVAIQKIESPPSLRVYQGSEFKKLHLQMWRLVTVLLNFDWEACIREPKYNFKTNFWISVYSMHCKEIMLNYQEIKRIRNCENLQARGALNVLTENQARIESLMIDIGSSVRQLYNTTTGIF